ncbi:MAG TPA: SDR family oxidoreductase [Noviherbaspirillum sp.]|nr:SDR family oxidoreductase [Noviherbaspirillum sp.]
MKVLLTGATGFIGRHLLRALLDAGHEVRCAVRDPGAINLPGVQAVAADFMRDHDEGAWRGHVAGMDAVINAVGILREEGGQTFDALHVRAPCALFAAAARAGVRLVVQISALGADANAQSRYHLSKKRADDFLATLPVASVILQPSLVYGNDGASARLFAMLAALPLIPLPGKGGQAVQPVHIDDLCAAVLALLRQAPSGSRRLAVIGAQPLALRDYLALLRKALGMGRGWYVPVPMAAMRLTAGAARFLPGALVDSETLQMLERGNRGSAEDVARLSRLLGRAPRAPAAFVGDAAPLLAMRAKLDWLLPLLRVSIALVWIVTGIVSLGLYPVADSYALLARVGATGLLATVLLYGAALLDLAIGIAVLVLRRRPWLWLLQLALIAGYTVIITLRLPEFWLHPYGPILKNLPLMAAIWIMYEFEKSWNT